MGSFEQIYFILTRTFSKCCDSKRKLDTLYAKIYDELQMELDILYLIKTFRKFSKTETKDLLDVIVKSKMQSMKIIEQSQPTNMIS